MAEYYAVNTIDGKSLVCVTAERVLTTSDYACNKIARVKIIGNEVVVWDENGHEFLRVVAQNEQDAQDWALQWLGYTVRFG